MKAYACILLAAAGATGCATTSPPPLAPEAAYDRAAFARDRDTCRSVAERSTPYVDPKDGRAVVARQMHVEGETQKCMAYRGWNDPTFDGWRGGRS